MIKMTQKNYEAIKIYNLKEKIFNLKGEIQSLKEENEKLKELLLKAKEEIQNDMDYTEFNEVGKLKLVKQIEQALGEE